MQRRVKLNSVVNDLHNALDETENAFDTVLTSFNAYITCLMLRQTCFTLLLTPYNTFNVALTVSASVHASIVASAGSGMVHVTQNRTRNRMHAS
jgi:tetrahydromethanopterin S-methyltransferase subunit B